MQHNQLINRLELRRKTSLHWRKKEEGWKEKKRQGITHPWTINIMLVLEKICWMLKWKQINSIIKQYDIQSLGFSTKDLTEQSSISRFSSFINTAKTGQIGKFEINGKANNSCVYSRNRETIRQFRANLSMSQLHIKRLLKTDKKGQW